MWFVGWGVRVVSGWQRCALVITVVALIQWRREIPRFTAPGSIRVGRLGWLGVGWVEAVGSVHSL